MCAATRKCKSRANILFAANSTFPPRQGRLRGYFQHFASDRARAMCVLLNCIHERERERGLDGLESEKDTMTRFVSESKDRRIKFYLVDIDFARTFIFSLVKVRILNLILFLGTKTKFHNQ